MQLDLSAVWMRSGDRVSQAPEGCLDDVAMSRASGRRVPPLATPTDRAHAKRRLNKMAGANSSPSIITTYPHVRRHREQSKPITPSW